MNWQRWLRRLLFPVTLSTLIGTQLYVSHRYEESKKRAVAQYYFDSSLKIVDDSEPKFSCKNLTYIVQDNEKKELVYMTIDKKVDAIISLKDVDMGDIRLRCRSPDDERLVFALWGNGTYIADKSSNVTKLSSKDAVCALWRDELAVGYEDELFIGDKRFDIPARSIKEKDGEFLVKGSKGLYYFSRDKNFERCDADASGSYGWFDSDTIWVASQNPARLYFWHPGGNAELVKEWNQPNLICAAENGRLFAFLLKLPQTREEMGCAIRPLSTEYYDGSWKKFDAKAVMGSWNNGVCCLYDFSNIHVFDSKNNSIRHIPNASYIGWHDDELVYAKGKLSKDLYIGERRLTYHDEEELSIRINDLWNSNVFMLLGLGFIGLTFAGQLIGRKNALKISEPSFNPHIYALASLPFSAGIAYLLSHNEFYEDLNDVTMFSRFPDITATAFMSSALYSMFLELSIIKNPLKLIKSRKISDYSIVYSSDIPRHAERLISEGKIEDAFTLALSSKPDKQLLVNPLRALLSTKARDHPLAKSIDALAKWEVEESVRLLDEYAESNPQFTPQVYTIAAQICSRYGLRRNYVKRILETVVNQGLEQKFRGGTSKKVFEIKGSQFLENAIRLYQFKDSSECKDEYERCIAVHRPFSSITPEPIDCEDNLMLVRFIAGDHPSGVIDISETYEKYLKQGSISKLNLQVLDYGLLCDKISKRLSNSIGDACREVCNYFRAVPQLFSHGNMHRENIIVGEGGTAIIDVGDLCLSRPSLDLAMLEMSGAEPEEPVDFLRRYHKMGRQVIEQEYLRALFIRGFHVLSRNKEFGEGDKDNIREQLSPVVKSLHPGLSW